MGAVTAVTPVARILLIDDEEAVREACAASLRDERYEVRTAATGEEGLALVREHRPDLVVMDLQMRGVSGFEALERIRETDPTIVTVVISGCATVSSAVEAMKRGAYDFLPKPVAPEEFRSIVRRGLEKRSLAVETLALRREREMLREQFAAILSHEVRSPLAAIQQNLFALRRELAPVATEDQLARLGRAKARIGDLIELLETWRGGTVDLTAVKARCAALPVQELVDAALESLAVHAQRKDVALRADVPHPSPEVRGDRITLTEVLVNVVGNAVKYSRPGGTVTVTAAASGDEVRLLVADAGVGIAEADFPRIFDAFWTAGTGTAGERGTGLGLAVSRRILEVHGGSIAVRSTPGRGSTFTITLPAFRGDGPAMAGGAARSRAEPAKEGRR